MNGLMLFGIMCGSFVVSGMCYDLNYNGSSFAFGVIGFAVVVGMIQKYLDGSLK